MSPATRAATVCGGVALVVLVVLRAAGHEEFPTDPVAGVALIAAAVAATVARARLLAASLLLYLVAGLAAVVTWPAVGWVASLWNVLWVPPLVLVQLRASDAVRVGAGRPLAHTVVIAAVGAAALTALPLTDPADPFAGVPAAAPEAWRSALAPVRDATTLLGMLSLLILPAVLWRAALTSQGAARARIGVAAAGATTAPLTVAFCLLLAVARNPGAVEPQLGSAAFLVALAGACGAGAWCGALAERGVVGGDGWVWWSVPRRPPSRCSSWWASGRCSPPRAPGSARRPSR